MISCPNICNGPICTQNNLKIAMVYFLRVFTEFQKELKEFLLYVAQLDAAADGGKWSKM